MLLRAAGAVEADALYKLDPEAGRSARVRARGGKKRSPQVIATQVAAMRERLKARAAGPKVEPKVVRWRRAVSVNAVASSSDAVNAAASRSGGRNKAQALKTDAASLGATGKLLLQSLIARLEGMKRGGPHALSRARSLARSLTESAPRAHARTRTHPPLSLSCLSVFNRQGVCEKAAG